MKSYKIELLINDHDEVGAEEIKTILEEQKYPNWCIAPLVADVKEADIGEWSDEHPFNKRDQFKAHMDKVFPNEYKEEFEKLRHICIGIYYARIAMREDLIIKGLEEIDAYFREPNMN